MATLPTPSINTIGVFDPAYNYSVSFVYTGSQAVKNRAVIKDNDTYEVVYDRSIASLKLSHTIPQGTLKVGHQYLIQIQVFDANGDSSNLSDSVLFYCYTTPSFQLDTIENPHKSANITLKAIYEQNEGEALKSYQYMLYDYAHQLIGNSDLLYGDISDYTFYGLDNNTQYYVRCVALTNHGFSLDTEEILVNVRYETIPANILFELENHKCDGYISLITNIVVIGYDLENDNYTFNSDGSVTIRNNSLTYNEGFSVEDDFSLYVEAKELPLGTFLRTQNDVFTLSIIDVCSSYYCEFKSGDYVLYRELPQAQLTTENGEILTDTYGRKIETISASYSNDTYIVFELKRENGIYNLRTYYRIDA